MNDFGQPQLRELNDQLAASATRHRFDDARVPFLCECGATDCEEFVLLTVADYTQVRDRGHSLLADGH